MSLSRQRVVAVVQARMGSSRLPGKVMLPLAGRPLLERMIERVRAARELDAFVVATTTDPADEPIRALCAELGVPVISGHPTDLLDRHVAAGRAVSAEVVAKIPSDCPLIDPAVIDRVVAAWRAAEGSLDFMSNLHPATYPDGNDVELMPLALLEQAAREAQKPHEREHTTPFFWDQPERFRVGNVRWETGLDLSMTHRLTIDYPEDYQLIARVYEALWRPDAAPFSLDAILHFLDTHPEVAELNRALSGVNWYRNHLDELRTVTARETRRRPVETAAMTVPNPAPETRLDAESLQRLQNLALKVREHIIHMATDGGCFIGASLSCADLLVHLYTRVLSVTPERVKDPDRDYLFLSKGHDVPALYGTLAELGFMDRARLKNHLKTTDDLYWHPNRAIPGVEFHSGSLGHLLSVSMGVALDARLRGSPSRVFVILGDGECDEGSIWEGLLVAAAHKLDNLVVVIDRNAFQANIRTEELIPLEPMAPKFEAFGWNVRRVDGHDFQALEGAFHGLPVAPGKPTVVIADTVRGKGLPSIEARADRWFVNFKAEEIVGLLQELHGGVTTQLTSEALIVR